MWGTVLGVSWESGRCSECELRPTRKHKTSLDTLTEFLVSLKLFICLFVFLVIAVMKRRPAGAGGKRARLLNTRKQFLGRCSRIGCASGRDEAWRSGDFKRDTEDIEWGFEKREDIQVLGPEICTHRSGREPSLHYEFCPLQNTGPATLLREHCEGSTRSFYKAFEAPSKHSSLPIWQTLLSNALKIYHISLPFFSP